MTAAGSTGGAPVRNISLTVITWIATAILLTGCGGGGGGSANPTPQASLRYPSSSLVFVVGTAITPVSPAASSGLSSFTVAPALPAGLSLNSSNGTLAGTPTAVSAAAMYTISASGGGASASASLSITVNPQPPSSPTYGASAITFTAHIAARTFTPTAGGGAATSWSITPSLPAGLTFDTTAGTISGTPTATSAPTRYVVTAQNAGGKATVNVTIEVDPDVVLDVGHDTAISTLRMSGSTVFSLDRSGHWNLWDYASASEIASGDLYCAPGCDKPDVPSHLADMAGGTVVLATQDGFEFLSAASGQEISSITASVTWWSLASDGSYLAVGSTKGLSAWLPSGDSVASLSGDYSKAMAFAAPGQIQLGEPNQNVIQTVSVPGGASTTGPAFIGSFGSWFLDGSRFITKAAPSTLVYSQAGTLQATMVFSSTTPLVGQGNWIWTDSGPTGTLQIFPVASSSAPVASLTVNPTWSEIPSGTTLAVATGDSLGFEVIDLSGTTLSETAYNNYNLSVYAAASTSQWMFGDKSGVLLDGASLTSTPRYFDYGAVSSIAGSAGLIAIATASGRIVYFDANTLAQQGVIPVSASKLALSADGSVLAALQDDGSIGIYSFPGASLLYTWSYPPSGGFVATGIGLSGSGALLTQVLLPTSGNTVPLEASPATGGLPAFAVSIIKGAAGSGFPPEIFVSPDGASFATTPGVPFSGANPGTDLWDVHANLLNAITGYPLGWIDDGHLLIATYIYIDPFQDIGYAGCAVYSPSGQSTGPCALPEVDAFQTVTSDDIYVVNKASILSVSTGSVLWRSGDPASLSLGAVAGNRVVVLSGARVLAQGH